MAHKYKVRRDSIRGYMDPNNWKDQGEFKRARGECAEKNVKCLLNLCTKMHISHVDENTVAALVHRLRGKDDWGQRLSEILCVEKAGFCFDKLVDEICSESAHPSTESCDVLKRIKERIKRDLTVIRASLGSILNLETYLRTQSTADSIAMLDGDPLDTPVPVLIARRYLRERVFYGEGRVEPRFFKHIESYGGNDIFPLPQYLDLTTSRHVKTRYFRILIMLALWIISSFWLCIWSSPNPLNPI